MGQRSSGTVKWFQNAKGFGFITRNDGGKDVFVHYSGIESAGGFKTLAEGDNVEFEIINSDKGDKAINVRKI